MKKLKIRILMLLTAIMVAFSGIFLFTNVEVWASDSSGKKILVALGDSYSAGEGIEPFFGQDKASVEKVQDEDWLAHRSEKAWSGKLLLDGKKIVKDDNWFFVAASGAQTTDFTGNQEKKYNYDGQTGTKKLKAQFDIFDQVNKKYGSGSIDYVTLTIGGNDVGFFSIMTTALLSPSKLEENLNGIWENFFNKHDSNGKEVPSIRDDIKNSYKAIAEKAGKQAAIIVAGYPHILNPDGFEISAGVLNSTVSSKTSKLINDATDKLNEELEKIVNECRDEGLNIYFVSVIDEFAGHEAYSSDPYINGLVTSKDTQDLTPVALFSVSAYSMHPNESGANAYAKAVQKVIDNISGTVTDKDDSNKSDNSANTKNTKPVITLTSKKGKITVKWNKVEGATKYKVIEYVDGKAKTVKTTSKTSVTIKNRTKGNNYTFAVKAKINNKWTKISSSDKKSITVK